MKTLTWKEIADEAREVGRRLAVHAFAGRATGSQFNHVLNCVRSVLRRAKCRRSSYSKEYASWLVARGFDYCYKIGAEG